MCALLLLLACASGDSSDERDAGPNAAAEESLQTTAVVLLVSPDSAEIEDLKRSMGADFYVAADDAMWYRASVYELLDSLGIAHREVTRGSARFAVGGDPIEVSWADVDLAWFAVVYDGTSAPVITADVELRTVIMSSADQRR